MVSGCGGLSSKNEAFELRSGDLLFRDSDCGVLCDAIEKVTTGYRGANFSHVGIVTQENDQFVVIEAVSDGVKSTCLKEYLTRSVDKKGRPKVMVGRLKSRYKPLIPKALENAAALAGKPYDKVFAVDNDAYYCSELIYEIFLQANNTKPVFILQPMTFKDPDTGKTLETWEEYFGNLGVAVPEGEAGINPGSISRSKALKIVYVYGNVSRKAGN